MKPLHRRGDLSRWNRAGLSRFRYVGGNAITHLESLRLAMVEALVDGKRQAGEKHLWTALETRIPAAENETPAEQQARWREQYFDERRDYAWEILRSFARAGHVLTEHLDAYANESFIGTASQWENVRRLVEMLDYHPAPPASAETALALLLKADQRGVVEAGLAVKNTPTDGSAPSIFETLHDLEAEPQLNELRAADWNRSQLPFYYAPHYTVFPLAAPVEEIAPGTVGVLLVEDQGAVMCGMQVTVSQVRDDRLILQGQAAPAALPSGLARHQMRLLLKPEFKRAPRLVGSNVVRVAPGHGLSVDDVIAWQEGGWRAARVEEQRGNYLRLSRTAPAQGTELFMTFRGEYQRIDGTRRIVLAAKGSDGRVEGALWSGSLSAIETATAEKTDATSGVVLYDYLNGYSYPYAYYLLSGPGKTWVQESQPQALVIDGDPGEFGAGDWVVLRSASGHSAAVITGLKESEKSFELQLSATVAEVVEVYGDFEIDLRPADADRNTLPVFETHPMLRSSTASYLTLERLPEALRIGRSLLVVGPDAAVAVTVKEIDSGLQRIKVSPAIPGSEPRAEEEVAAAPPAFARWHTRIYGNVVAAGHGETQNSKILGSGDASQKNQRFVLAVEAVSFVRDNLFPTGVRAALEVTVEQRRWTQLASLNEADAEDTCYCVRMNEDGTLTIEFGDGRHGRRLPTGSNNVRVAYRVGVGLGANLAAGSLAKLVKPHSLIKEVKQPLIASGGNEMESVAALRQNAPASVLALSRAVSLNDFRALAQANSSVWQAQASLLPGHGGARRQIDVVVVPTGGGPLGGLKADLQATLTQHALPGVNVIVSDYQSVLLDLAIRIRVNREAYEPDFVKEDVLAAVTDAFSLQQSTLGKSLFISQIMAVIESVEGVENADCVMNPGGFRDSSGVAVVPRQVLRGNDGTIKRVSLTPRQVMFIAPSLSVLTIEVSDYRL